MESFRGMVTEAPPKSGEDRMGRRSSALEVSKGMYVCGRPVARKAALCIAGDLDWLMGSPKR